MKSTWHLSSGQRSRVVSYVEQAGGFGEQVLRVRSRSHLSWGQSESISPLKSEQVRGFGAHVSAAVSAMQKSGGHWAIISTLEKSLQRGGLGAHFLLTQS